MAEAELKEQPVKKSDSFTLPNEKIRIEFVPRERGMVKNKNHVMYGGMLEGSKRELVPKKSRNTFKYIPILDTEEMDYLENVMGLEKGALNFYKPENNYWDSISITLLKEGIDLDLSNPVHYIQYKIAISYDSIVAPSLADLKVKNKWTYMFVVIRKGERDAGKAEQFDIKKEAYTIAAKLETNMENVKEFLYLYGVNLSRDVSIRWLKGKLGEIVEDNPQKVIDIYSSKDYSARALIAKGVLSGVIKEVNGRYYLEDGLALCYDNMQPTLSNAIKFLKDKRNTTIKNKILAKLG